MNEKSQMLNKSQVLNQAQISSHSQMMNQSQPMNQAQLFSQSQMMNQNQPQLINQSQLMNQPPLMMTQNQAQMMNRGYGLWAQPPQPKASMDSIKFQTSLNPNFTASKSSSMPGRSNWKGKRGMDKRKDLRRNEQQKEKQPLANSVGYKPPSLQELQSQNRLKARRFYPKKKYNNRFAPYAPRNTTSFIIRAKKSGGIASLVSPYPVTPAVLPTPKFSPSREVLGDMAKEEWGVDGYGSMKGLIRLRSPGNEAEVHDEEDDEEGGSSESDVEEHVEVERRLDHDLSRFEMIYPNCGVEYNNVLENRVDDQDSHIAQLEEENLTLKERLFLMERELGDLRRRMQSLERQAHVVDYMNEEVVENGSDNGSESSGKGSSRAMNGQNNENESGSSGKGDFCAMIRRNNEEVVEYVLGNSGSGDIGVRENNEEVEYVSENQERRVNAEEENNNEALDVSMEEIATAVEKQVIADEDKANDGEARNACLEKSIGDDDL